LPQSALVESPFASRSVYKAGGSGVQALSMNSLRSAWTPLPAGLKILRWQAKADLEVSS